MSAALIGGMDRLKRDYITAAKNKGISLKVFTGQERSIKNRLGDVDFLVLFTAKVSHAARKEVLQHAKSGNIPLKMIHASGVSALKKCLEEERAGA